MFIAKVMGTVVSTIKHPVYAGKKIMVVQPLNLDGSPKGDSLLAVDEVQAGVGDTVLVLNEGSGARQIVQNEQGPIRAIIMGIVDQYGEDAG